MTNRTLDLSFGRLEDYPAAYARYLDLREERMTRRLQEYEEQQEFIARTEEFIRRYKAGQRSREARGRQTRLDRLERIERPAGAHRAEAQYRRPTIRSGREVITDDAAAGRLHAIGGERDGAADDAGTARRARRPRRHHRRERQRQSRRC